MTNKKNHFFSFSHRIELAVEYTESPSSEMFMTASFAMPSFMLDSSKETWVEEGVWPRKAAMLAHMSSMVDDERILPRAAASGVHALYLPANFCPFAPSPAVSGQYRGSSVVYGLVRVTTVTLMSVQ